MSQCPRCQQSEGRDKAPMLESFQRKMNNKEQLYVKCPKCGYAKGYEVKRR